MESEISEFSYGYALTSELISRYKLSRVGAPVFATQSAEGKKGGGWDMKLPGVPIYLQFKRASRMVRRSASNAGLFAGLPFFRAKVWRKTISLQHELMLELESRGNDVLYAAPAFSWSSELHKFFTEERVIEHTLFVRPSAIGPILDDNHHSLIFQKPGRAWFCSEPRQLESVEISEVLRSGLRGSEKATLKTRAEVADRSANELIEVFFEVTRRPTRWVHEVRAVRERRSPEEFLGVVARTLFDLDVLFVVPATGDL